MMAAMLRATALFVLLAPAAAHAQAIDPAARAAVIAAQQEQAARKAYRVVSQTTDLVHKHSASEMLAYVAPDRYHSMDLDGLVQLQVIRIGSKGWMRARSEPWQPEITDSASVLRWFRGPAAIDDAGHTLLEARALGEADLRGARTRMYEYALARDADRLRVKMWVAVATGLPVKFEADVKRGTSHDRVTWDIEYDDTIQIMPPVK